MAVHVGFFHLNLNIYLGRPLKTTTSIDQVRGIFLFLQNVSHELITGRSYILSLSKFLKRLFSRHKLTQLKEGYPAKWLFFDYLNSYSHSPPE